VRRAAACPALNLKAGRKLDPEQSDGQARPSPVDIDGRARWRTALQFLRTIGQPHARSLTGGSFDAAEFTVVVACSDAPPRFGAGDARFAAWWPRERHPASDLRPEDVKRDVDSLLDYQLRGGRPRFALCRAQTRANWPAGGNPAPASRQRERGRNFSGVG
jgi:hypothetical protein